MIRSGAWGPGTLIVALAASLTHGADTMPAAPTTPESTTPTLAVLGDSLSVSPSVDASFPAVLEGRLREAGYRWRVINAGRNGDTTAQGLARLDDVLREAPTILIVALGANDGLRGVPVATVRRHLDQIITRARAEGSAVLLCGMETPPLRGWDYTVAFHDIYPALAREHAVRLVPFLLAGVFGNLNLNQPDMVHPNAAGARRIADTVWALLEPMLRKREAAGSASR
jgi:acyl-CoA thioesterase-1